MDKCFVIQPFDNGKYDKRYSDIFKPAIEKANLYSYRIDKEPNVTIPIQEIEQGITDAAMCFAEITTDNPNVWYELGYAIACKKDVVMVCSEERLGKFPFDIQHRLILTYKTGSTSDFDEIKHKITEKLIALRQTTRTAQSLHSSPVVPTEGLKSQEITLMILVMQNEVSGDNSMPIWTIKQEMQKAGFNDLGTSFALTTLSKKGMIDIIQDYDRYNNNFDNEYKGCKLTELGQNWMLDNENLFTFNNEISLEVKQEQINYVNPDDDLPF